MDGMMTGMGLWGLLVLLTVLALLVLAVLGSVWFYLQLRDRQSYGETGAGEVDSATRRLRERFAAGEIDEQEFESRLSALTHWC